MPKQIRVWDLPTRTFHWALVICVAGLVITGKVGGSAMVWHSRLGYAVLTLLLFRLAWGLVGGYWSRFASFIYAPGSVMNYLKGRPHPDHVVGHNPMGAGSVFLMLLVLLIQVSTGLVSDDEISFTGPLNKFVASSAGLAATAFHKQFGQWLIIGLVVLHVAAILFYWVKKKENLVGPMLTGDKTVGHDTRSSRDDLVTRGLAACLLAIAVAAVIWVVRLGG